MDAQTPFDRIGGAPVVQAIVDRFYTLMDREPAYAGLRAIHAPDLTPMRQSLGLFLTAWLGGPRDWFDQRPGVCMMGMHRAMAIDTALAAQWADAMAQAIAAEPTVDRAFGLQLAGALDRMCRGMVTREAVAAE
ncbi:globin [Sphingomonas sp. CJ20]